MICYFLSNTSAKHYRYQIMCVKILASRRWDVFSEARCNSKNPVSGIKWQGIKLANVWNAVG